MCCHLLLKFGIGWQQLTAASAAVTDGHVGCIALSLVAFDRHGHQLWPATGCRKFAGIEHCSNLQIRCFIGYWCFMGGLTLPLTWTSCDAPNAARARGLIDFRGFEKFTAPSTRCG